MTICNSQPGPASFSVDDRILLGEGVFETLRIKAGQPCLARWHWERITQAAETLLIPLRLSYEQWLTQLNACIENRLEGGVKVILSGGTAERGLTASGKNPQLVFQFFSYQPDPGPIQLVSAPWLRCRQNPVYGIKSVNYLEAILARRHALSHQADDALFFNMEQGAMETTVANLFMIRQGRLFTPSLDQGILPGVLRRYILEQSAGWGLTCEETYISREQLLSAEALLVCNALQGIKAVSSLDGKAFDVGHAIIKRLETLINPGVI